MRRKDREVTDNYEINKIINSCQIIRLAGLCRRRCAVHCAIELWL